MTTQPEALRLADDVELNHKYCPVEVLHEAAAELRRLHAENEVMRNVANRGGHIAVAMSRIADLEAQRDALLEALQEAAEALEIAADNGGVNFYQYAKEARAAIKAVEETK